MIHPQNTPPPAVEARQPETSRALELGASTGSAPSSACEVVDQWPDSAGWWWCRNLKTWMPGDEMCVEVMMPGPYNGFAILWHQEPCPLEDFAGFEWRKAESPFLPNDQFSEPPSSLKKP